MNEQIKQRIPEPALQAVRLSYHYGQKARHRTLYAGYRLGILDLDDIYEDAYYAKRRNDPWRSDGHNVSQAIANKYNPDSVIDFGCAIGGHLETFHDDGVAIHGVEGNDAAFNYAVVPKEALEQYDLRERYVSDKTYDLALCFELAEHLPESSADELVETLVGAGETIVMTAATPDQKGKHHTNLQPREYWIEKFRERGASYDGRAVEHLRNQIDVERTTWIPKNLLVFEQ